MIKSAIFIKKFLALFLVVLMSIESFAAVVSDNDGAAFITKAEFDSLKNEFQSQINSYNATIDSKIEAAIAGYIAGVASQRTEDMNLMLWGGRKLGLIENEYARPYGEGTVGGRLDFSYYAAIGDGQQRWYTGWTKAAEEEWKDSNPHYFVSCFHRFTCDSVPFRYGIVDINKTGDNYNFLLVGYGNVVENLVGVIRKFENKDATQRMEWTLGLCSGVIPMRWELDKNPFDWNRDFIEFCECTTRTAGEGSYATRGEKFTDHHNQYMLYWDWVDLTSNESIFNDLGFITNSAPSVAINGIRPRDWRGVNMTNGSTETHTPGEFHMWGWSVVGARGTTFNHHIHANPPGNSMYNSGAGVYDRLIQGDPSYSAGAGRWHYPTSYTHGVVADDSHFHKLYKADIGGELTSDNLYSNELAAVIKQTIGTGLKTLEFSGITQDVSPLYLGLPIARVKANDIVELELELLDSEASYDIAFTVNGFANQPIDQSVYANAGCVVDGLTNHIVHFTSSRTDNKQKIKVKVEKPGILFLKYGASGGTSEYIQLPAECRVTHQQ